MKRSTFKILFYIKRSDPKQNGCVAIIGRITIDGERAQFSYLHEIADICGIDKKITFHVARHTFATLCLTMGMPIESISKMLGHTKIKTTQIYARLIDKKLSEDMNIFAEKLNDTAELLVAS